MAFQPISRFKNISVPAGNTIANDTNELTFSSTHTIPANSLQNGDVFRVTLCGVYSTFAVAPTLTGKFKFGGTILLNSGALTSVAGVTNAGWRAEFILIIVSTGASGSVEAQGFAQFATAATTALQVAISNTAAVTIDTTVDNICQLTAQWSAANAANSITLRQMILEKI